jgi:hypothetical protein
LQAWLERNAQIFDQLHAAVTALANSAVRAARMAEQHGADNAATTAELEQVTTRAARLSAVVHHAQALQPIPDADTRRRTAGLAHWKDAAKTIAAAGRDLSELARVAEAAEAGTNEFLRSAAALRRVTDQHPTSSNRFS